MRDRITASEITRIRTASQNPINMTQQDKGTAFNELIAVKQTGLRRLVDRRIEWFFAQSVLARFIIMGGKAGDAFMNNEHVESSCKNGGTNTIWQENLGDST